MQKNPLVMGFGFVSDDQAEPVLHERHEGGDRDIEIAPEDEIVGQEIGGGERPEGAEVPQQGRLVVMPSPNDKVTIERQPVGYKHYVLHLLVFGLSTSGSKLDVCCRIRRRMNLKCCKVHCEESARCGKS